MTILQYIALGLAVFAMVAAFMAVYHAIRTVRLARKSVKKCEEYLESLERMADARALQQSDGDMALMLSDLKAKREGRSILRPVPKGDAVLRYHNSINKIGG